MMENGRGMDLRLSVNNVDKNVCPSLQRLDHHTQSLHYFHSFAVLDWVDFSSLSDAEPPIGEIDTALSFAISSRYCSTERGFCCASF